MEEAGAGRRVGIGESPGLSGLDGGTGALSELDVKTGAFSGLDSGKGALSPSEIHRPRYIISSPSATVQGLELLSALSLSAAFSLMAGAVAGTRNLVFNNLSGSGSVAILTRRNPGRWACAPHSKEMVGLGTGSGCVLDWR